MNHKYVVSISTETHGFELALAVFRRQGVRISRLTFEHPRCTVHAVAVFEVKGAGERADFIARKLARLIDVLAVEVTELRDPQ